MDFGQGSFLGNSGNDGSLFVFAANVVGAALVTRQRGFSSTIPRSRKPTEILGLVVWKKKRSKENSIRQLKGSLDRRQACISASLFTRWQSAGPTKILCWRATRIVNQQADCDVRLAASFHYRTRFLHGGTDFRKL